MSSYQHHTCHVAHEKVATMMVHIERESMTTDRVLLLVVFDCLNGGGEGRKGKIRIREKDLPAGAAFVSGKHLCDTLIATCSPTDRSNTTIEIFDPFSETFEALDNDMKNVVDRFGRCIRCIVVSAATCAEASRRLTIMGRRFPYDADIGFEIAGTRIHVQETPNVPGAGTGLNVWDGAMLLYVFFVVFHGFFLHPPHTHIGLTKQVCCLIELAILNGAPSWCEENEYSNLARDADSSGFRLELWAQERLC